MNGIVTVQSGAPFTVNISEDRANIGAGPAQRPNLTGDPNASGRTPDRWFNTGAFSLHDPFTFGSAPRNAVIGPGLANVDMSLQKNWVFPNASRLEFRWEVFNVLNRANFDIPNRVRRQTSPDHCGCVARETSRRCAASSDSLSVVLVTFAA